MADNPGRSYLPPTVPNPSNQLRRQNPLVSTQAPHNFYSAPQQYHVGPGSGIASKPYLQMLGSSSPQSEGIDLTARPPGQPEAAHNGGDPVNGQVKENTAPGVIVIAPNPLAHSEESVKPMSEPKPDNVPSGAEPWDWKGVDSFRSGEFNVESRINKTPATIASTFPAPAAAAAVPVVENINPAFHHMAKASDPAGFPIPFEAKGPPPVSVIAPNPLVQPGEPKAAESSWDRRYDPYRPPPDLSKRSSPLGPSSFGPVPASEAKPSPAHPSMAMPPDQAGIPPFFDRNCPPSVSEGMPSHPVESKVVARSREGGAPMDPTVEPAAAVPAVAPTDPNQLANLGADDPHEPSLPPNPALPGFQPQRSDPLPPSPFSKPSESSSPSPAAEPSVPDPMMAPAPPEPSVPDPSTDHAPTPSSASSANVREKPLAPENVESLLENMFGAGESPLKLPSSDTSTVKPQALTEDKVVAILEDEAPLDVCKPEKEVEVKPKPEPLEVESELEKMFAGIIEPADESQPSKSKVDVKVEPGTSAAGSAGASTLSDPTTISPKKKRRLPRPRVRKSVDSDTGSSLKRKRKTGKVDSPIKSKGVKRPNQERFKDTSNDSHSLGLSSSTRKGPFVRIEGPKDRPKRVRVVNSGTKDEDDRDGGLDKAMVRRKHNAQAESRLKGTGLFPSTLSAKYNSANADITWFCVFCKLRSNCERGLGHEPAGDLYGPYFLTVRSESDEDVKAPKDSEVAAEQKRKGGGRAKSLRAANVAEQFILNMAKKSKKQTGTGENPLSGEQEIWVHEKCILWAPGVYLVGPHLVGLAEAVAAAYVTKCSYCNHFGASLGCVMRNCPARCHYGCAVATRWDLNEETFISRCPNHVKVQKS